MFEAGNTKKQGDIGVGAAIAYFTRRGFTVCIPLTDSQSYDLVVEKEGTLSRVQVKTTSYKRGGMYQVSMTVKGGNRSGAGKIKRFDSTAVDLVFVLTSDDSRYLIPSIACGDNVSLGKKFSVFKV